MSRKCGTARYLGSNPDSRISFASRTSIADEMRIEHTRRVLGE